MWELDWELTSSSHMNEKQSWNLVPFLFGLENQTSFFIQSTSDFQNIVPN